MPEVRFNCDTAVSAETLTDQLESINWHVFRADKWAQEHLARFPNLQTVSISLGAAFLLQFEVTLTFSRQK